MAVVVGMLVVVAVVATMVLLVLHMLVVVMVHFNFDEISGDIGVLY